jgi:branched-chain amino acid transport system permease protein
MAIRDHDIAAEAIGVDVVRYKVLAFAVSSGFVGLAGALTAHYRSIVTFERFTLEVSILYLAIIIVGGLGSILGSILGAGFMFVLPAIINQAGQSLQVSFLARQLPAIQLGVFGLVIVLFLIFEPRGLARIWQRAKDYFRLWPFRY